MHLAMLAFRLSLHWRHNDHDGVSNHQPHGCLLNRLFRRRSKKTSELCVTGLCGEFTGTGEFPAQRASYAENVSIWWRHHDAQRRWVGEWFVTDDHHEEAAGCFGTVTYVTETVVKNMCKLINHPRGRVMGWLCGTCLTITFVVRHAISLNIISW